MSRPLAGFERRPTPSRHDHVGQMVYLEDTAACIGEHGCGQEWEMTYKPPAPDGRRDRAGWRPIPDE